MLKKLSKLSVLRALVAVSCLALLCVGCEDSDDDATTDTEGNSQVWGRLSSSGGDVVINSMVPAAVVAGVTVTIDGPVYKQVATDGDGVFEFDGLPAGTYTLTFTVDGVAYSYTITIGDDERHILKKIKMNSDGTVTVGDYGIVRVDEGDDTADISGNWTFVQNGGVPANGVGLPWNQLVVNQSGKKTSGQLGTQFTFTGTVDRKSVTFDFTSLNAVGFRSMDAAEGTVSKDGNTMSGTWTVNLIVTADEVAGEQTWTATRGAPVKD